MTVRTACLTLMLLAGCATTSPQPVPSAPSPAVAGTISPAAPPPGATATPSSAPSAGPSDWALAIVGTPFVFAFRTVVCAATAVVAGPTAGLLALSDEREAGLDYLRWGLAENCGGPYVVPVPVAAGYRAEPDVRYSPDARSYPEPEVEEPRRLTPYSSAAVMP